MRIELGGDGELHLIADDGTDLGVGRLEIPNYEQERGNIRPGDRHSVQFVVTSVTE